MGDYVELLLPDGAQNVPEPVKKANDAALHAFEQQRAAQAEVRAAQEQVKSAGAIDDAADRAAVAAGKPLPDERAVNTAREALVAADRRLKAAQGVYHDRRVAHLDALLAAKPMWEPELRESVELHERVAKDTIKSLRSTIEHLRAERAVLAGLQAVPAEPGLPLGVDFGRRDERWAAQRAQETQERVVAESRYGNLRHSVDRRDTDELLAALALTLDELVNGQ